MTKQTIKQAADKELSERTIERQTKTPSFQSNFQQSTQFSAIYQARALRALGLLLADGTPTVGGGKTF